MSEAMTKGLYYDPVGGRCIYCDRRAVAAGVNALSPAPQRDANGVPWDKNPATYEPPKVEAMEPVAWRREWEGDISDANHMIYEESKSELDAPVDRWEPLYAHSDVAALLSSQQAEIERLAGELAAVRAGYAEAQDTAQHWADAECKARNELSAALARLKEVEGDAARFSAWFSNGHVRNEATALMAKHKQYHELTLEDYRWAIDAARQ